MGKKMYYQKIIMMHYWQEVLKVMEITGQKRSSRIKDSQIQGQRYARRYILALPFAFHIVTAFKCWITPSLRIEQLPFTEFLPWMFKLRFCEAQVD